MFGEVNGQKVFSLPFARSLDRMYYEVTSENAFSECISAQNAFSECTSLHLEKAFRLTCANVLRGDLTECVLFAVGWLLQIFWEATRENVWRLADFWECFAFWQANSRDLCRLCGGKTSPLFKKLPLLNLLAGESCCSVLQCVAVCCNAERLLLYTRSCSR